MSLQLLTSYTPSQANRLYDVVSQSIDAGCKKVQFSWGNCTDKELYSKAEQIRHMTHNNDVEMIVNNRLDVALAVEADMLWIGQRDIPFEVARDLLPKGVKIGVSVGSPKQVSDLKYKDADCFGIGPVFKTVTKTDAILTWGLESIKTARQRTNKPLVAIGGITTGNARQVRDAGADELAVIGEIYRSNNIKQTVGLLLP